MAADERIVPILVYDDIQKAHDFLVRVFGFASGGVHKDDDGQVVHGEVKQGDAKIWLHRAAPELHLVSARSRSDASGGLVVYVDDVDAHFQRTRKAGGRIDSEPQDQDYGQREYGVTDLEGHRWWFATPLS
jgi:uncharacterized glyoxalase superfamily protein PhnB